MKIKSFCPKLKKQFGFTMIELLIVIAILGILAVAVLSAINPIEQINRGRDTGSRSDAEQLLSAIERFYAMTGYYPWTLQVGVAPTLAWTPVKDTWVTPNGLGFTACPVLRRLSETGASAGICNDEPGTQELKLTFTVKVNDDRNNDLYVYHDSSTYSSTYVCFAPQSAAFQQEAAERISQDLPSDYPPDGTAYNAPVSGNCGPQGNCICLP